MELTDKNKYKLFDPILHEISKELTLNKDHKGKHVDAFREVLDEFRKKLGEADPFLTLFREIRYSGSYANGIRIKTADEFDMMIYMKLPDEMQVSVINSPYPAYVQLKTVGLEALKKKQNWDKYKCLEKWLDSKQQFLLQNKFREWFESIITKIFNQLTTDQPFPVLTVNGNRYRLSMKKANPAFTLNVEKLSNEGIKFDVDLVPNFYFKLPMWPPIVKKKYSEKFTAKDWCTIAKPIYNDNENRHKCWRIVLPTQEYEVLQGHNNMKGIIRFMKQLRDVHKMPCIKSYFINTIFMWEWDKQSPDFWNNKLSFLFMHMLQRMRDYISEEKIPYFWDNKLNLLEKPSSNQLKDCVIKIDNIFKRIEKNYPANPRIIADILDSGRVMTEAPLICKSSTADDKPVVSPSPSVSSVNVPTPHEGLNNVGVLSVLGAVAGIVIAAIFANNRNNRN